MGADQRPLAIAVMGPTASGKTATAIALAQQLGGEIVSVDSALVYRGLEIGSAKPDAAERAQAPHHLLDLRDPWQTYSAAEFAADAARAVADIVARGRMPILAGGTGLYFRALLQGLSPMPPADPDTRARIAEQAAAEGWAALHAELAGIDPVAAARIHATDPQRIQRALEVYRLSGTRSANGRSCPAWIACRCVPSNWCWPRASAASCISASRPASTPCWPTASWTRSAPCAPCRR